jgi:trigger factor
VEITVNDLTSVDKEILIEANREDLQPNFNKAYKKYKGQINMPGFRPGRIPLGLIKKRFGTEIEAEEVRNYVIDVYQNKVVEDFDIVGEPVFEDLKWENDELEATLKVGVKPEFDLIDIESVEVEKMVHDVTDEEVEEELESRLKQDADWKEFDGEITKEHKILFRLTPLDEDGKPVADEKEEGLLYTPEDDEYGIIDDIVGKKAGDEVEVTIDEDLKNILTITKVEAQEVPELTDELAKELSNGEAEDVDSYKSFLKSQIQSYYDRSAEDTAKNSLMEELVKAHDFEVPETLVNLIIKQRLDEMKQQYKIEADLNIEDYRESFGDQPVKDGKWHFITEKLKEKFADDIELNEADIDAHFEQQAAQMGVGADMLKNVYASNPNELENLRQQIREEKVYGKALEAVSVKEISKDEYQEKVKKQQEEAKAKRAEESRAAAEAEDNNESDDDVAKAEEDQAE